MGQVQVFMAEAMHPGVLDRKEKERIALGMARSATIVLRSTFVPANRLV